MESSSEKPVTVPVTITVTGDGNFKFGIPSMDGMKNKGPYTMSSEEFATTGIETFFDMVDEALKVASGTAPSPGE